ncbi:hypothetical protein NC652_037636 [Populus alba x Populus x berolinensis]|nr:hypothetical protein NC652_037636 [Populus alba x Populus x berolinensis]
MSKLPQDIINDVLTYLPFKSLIRFKCVCKLWRSSISDPKFVKSHLKRAKEVNSSCHRLLLSTRTPQSVDFEAASGVLPSLLGILGSFNGIICSFVDYEKLVLWNSSTRDSKELTKPGLCPVLTLKTKTWRKVPDIGNATTSVEAYQGIFCNGAALWLGMQEIASKKEIACAHLANAMEAISRQGHMIKNMIARQGISEKMIQAPS